MSAMEQAEKTCGEIERFYSEAETMIHRAKSSDEVEQIRVDFLGKKGKFSSILSRLKNFSNEERKLVGQTANQLKTRLEKNLEHRKSLLKEQELEESLLKDSMDASLPGVHFPQGALHPIRQALREAVRILELAGLKAAYGPEVEYEDYCFDRLNFKSGHPARDMQATFFVKSSQDQSLILRTHTSPVQVRVLMDLAKKDFPIPVRIQVPGRVYRVDDDRTHSPMFHQIEGLVVDQHSTMGDLRAVLDFFCRKFFGDKVKVRFRPSYFPFTEPSAEVDVSCVFCQGEGCKVCKQSGWLEIAGAGLVHPEVFRACGWDPQNVQGWAFGMGVERLAMLKMNVPDLRSFFENRIHFLKAEGGVQ